MRSPVIRGVYIESNGSYSFGNGWTTSRSKSPPRWVLYDETGKEIDRHRYRIDLFERYDLKVID